MTKEYPYPLHPGQTHADPYYCTIPLEEYEALKKRVRKLEIPQDEYDRINSRIAELEEERRWRKFSEEKPKHHQWILVFYPNHSQFTTGVELRRWDEGCKYDVEEQEIYEKWMPLPSAPKETK